MPGRTGAKRGLTTHPVRYGLRSRNVPFRKNRNKYKAKAKVVIDNREISILLNTCRVYPFTVRDIRHIALNKKLGCYRFRKCDSVSILHKKNSSEKKGKGQTDFRVQPCPNNIWERDISGRLTRADSTIIAERIRSHGENYTPHFPKQIQNNINKIFTTGYWNEAKFIMPDGDEHVGGDCNMLANYLAFGWTDYFDYLNWGPLFTHQYYKKLPEGSYDFFKTKASKFDESKLHPGDLLQLVNIARGVYHSIFYIGNGKYLNSHGWSDIFIQSFSGVLHSYEFDHLHEINIIRMKNTNTS